MPQRILGIDLGSWSVKAVLIETSFRGFRVEHATECPLSFVNPSPKPVPKEGEDEAEPTPVSPGSPMGTEERDERQQLALEKLINDEILKADAYVASFPGEDTAFRFVNLPFADIRKVSQIFEGELEDLVPFDLYDGVFDYEILERTPVKGGSGSSLSLAAVAKKDTIRQFLDRLAEAGTDPKFLPVDVLGLYNLYTHFLAQDGTRPQTPDLLESQAADASQPLSDNGEEDLLTTVPDGRLLIDIGHTRTLVLAASEKGISHARVIRMGGADVTRAISKAYSLTWEQAEEGKHTEGRLVTRQRPAANNKAQRLSDVISNGISPLVRELRRTLASIKREGRINITRIDLLGGGSCLGNLPQFLAEALDTSVGMGAAVEQNVEQDIIKDRRPAFAGALANALRVSGEAPINTLDFRRGDLSFSGGLQHLKGRLPTIATAVGALIILLGLYGILKTSMLSAREAEVDQEFCRVTKEVIGREICEPDVAESVIRNPSSDLGTFRLPEVTAYDMLLELSAKVPSELDVKVTDLSVSAERAVVEGDAPSLDAVESLVAAYDKSKCLSDIEKGPIRDTSNGQRLEFQLKMKVECS